MEERRPAAARRVLLVEDDKLVQTLAQTALANAGFQIEICGTAAEAVRSFSLNPPGLVILDIGLPDASGLELCRTLGLGVSIDTPFVFLSARDDLETRLAAFTAGAHDYIQKPFSVQELIARVNVQFHIRRLHDDLSRKNAELEVMNRARQDVTDMIVHDLKTPLASIMGTIGLIQSRGLITEGSSGHLVESAGAAADFMLLMLNDLLDVGRAETTGLKIESAPLELEPFLEKIRRLFATRLERSKKTLVFAVAPDAREITTDHVLVFRILVNLISNAMKVVRPGSSVEVEAAREGSGVRFRVLDRGPGVPDSLKKEIFEKYSTLQPKSLSEDGGTGIGLTFCRLAAQAVGGRIWAEDRPGGGSAFVLLLPSAI